MGVHPFVQPTEHYGTSYAGVLEPPLIIRNRAELLVSRRLQPDSRRVRRHVHGGAPDVSYESLVANSQHMASYDEKWTLHREDDRLATCTHLYRVNAL
jgi:hypothetical protein